MHGEHAELSKVGPRVEVVVADGGRRVDHLHVTVLHKVHFVAGLLYAEGAIAPQEHLRLEHAHQALDDVRRPKLVGDVKEWHLHTSMCRRGGAA